MSNSPKPSLPVPAVVYITPDGALPIRSVNNDSATITMNAKALKARFVVAAFDRDARSGLPLWEVFDMRKVVTHLPGGQGDVALPVPLKEFVAKTGDAAVMYALARLAEGY